MTFPSPAMRKYATASDSTMFVLPIGTVLHRSKYSLRLGRSLAIVAARSRQVRIALHNMPIAIRADSHRATIVFGFALDDIGDELVDLNTGIGGNDNCASSADDVGPRGYIDMSAFLEERHITRINEIHGGSHVRVGAVPPSD